MKKKEAYEELSRKIEQLQEENMQLQNQIKEEKKQNIEQDIRLENYNKLINKLEDFIFIFDKDGKIIKINDVVSIRLGYSKEDLYGKNIRTIYPISPSDEKELYFQLRLFGKALFDSSNLIGKNGKIIPVETKVYIHNWKNRELLFATCRDVIAEKDTKNKLHFSEQKFYKTFQLNPSPMLLYNCKLKQCVDINENFLKQLKFKRNDVLKKDFSFSNFFLNPKDFYYFCKNLEEKGRLLNFEMCYLTKEGEERTGLFSGEIIEPENGQLILIVITDITETKKSHESLKKWKDVYDNVDVGVIVTSSDGETIDFANPAFAKMHNYSLEELSGISFNEFISEVEVKNIQTKYKTSFSNKNIQYESFHKKKDGTTFPVSVYLTSVKDENGKLLYRIANIHNIEQRKKAEENLHLKEKAIKESINAVTFTDSKGCLTFLNDSALEMWGYNNKNEILGKKISELYQDEETFDIVGKALRKEKKWQGEAVTKRKDGSLFISQVSVNRLYNEKGEHIYTMGSYIDITQKKNAQEELKKSQIQLKAILDNIPFMAWLKDIDGRFLAVNKTYAESIKLPINKIIGKTDTDIYGKDLSQISVKSDAEIIKTKQKKYWEHKIGKCWFETFKTPIFDVKGNLFGTTGISKDITTRKLSEEKLKKSEHRFREFAEMLPVIVFEINTRGELTFINQTATNVLGIEKKDLKNKINIFQIFVNKEYKKLRKIIWNLIKKGKIRSEELTLINKDKQMFTGLAYMNLTENRNLPTGMRCVIVDISERKLYEEQIKTTEIRLKNAQKVAHIGTWEYDFKKNISYWSDETFRILDYDENKPTANFKLLIDHIHPDYKRFISQIITTSLDNANIEQEYEIDYEYYILTHKKQKKFIRLKADIERDNTGKATKIYGTLHDITNRKDAEEKINLSIQRQEITSQIRHTFQSNNKLDFSQRANRVLEILGSILDFSKIFIYENFSEEQMIKMYEWKNPKLKTTETPPVFLNRQQIQTSISKIIEDSFLLYENFEQDEKNDLFNLFKNQKIKSLIAFPLFIKSKIHGFFILTQNYKYRKLHNNNINLIGSIAFIISDAYERELYDINLRQKSEERKVLLSLIPATAYLKDRKHNYITANQSFTRQTNCSIEEITGKTDFDFLEYTKAIKQQNLDEKVMQKGIAEYNVEEKITTKNGLEIWHSTSRVPYYDANKNVIGIVSITWDVTEMKKKEKELIQAKQQAEEAALAKQQFLSTMSHEIRTPMNAVIGLSYLLLQDKHLPEQTELLKNLKFSAKSILALINDILDFSKIDAGKIIFEENDFNLIELCKGIAKTFIFKAEEKEIELELDIDQKLPNCIQGDSMRLSQVLNNLLSNAIKFTSKGYVKLKLILEKEINNETVINFSVKDTGIGIPSEKHKIIFESFSQAASDTSRKYGGTGLGLAITQKLLEMQGSKIHVSSKINEGSVFYFSLKFQKSLREKDEEEKSKNKHNYQSLKGKKILLVEDNKMNQFIAKKFLERWGVILDFALNGVEAINKVKSSDYQLILMDLQMPKLDGYQATKIIRNESSKTKQELPIIALTASMISEVQNKIYDCGMNDFISKPFTPKDLFKKIKKHIG